MNGCVVHLQILAALSDKVSNQIENRVHSNKPQFLNDFLSSLDYFKKRKSYSFNQLILQKINQEAEKNPVRYTCRVSE